MIDYAAIITGTTVNDAELPSAPGRAPKQPNPFLALVKAAVKDNKRRDLPGRYSLKPYAGRVNACEAYTVMNKLHAAARELGVKVNVRKIDANDDDTGLTFKVGGK